MVFCCLLTEQEDFLALFTLMVQASVGQTTDLQHTTSPAETFGDWAINRRKKGDSRAVAGKSSETLASTDGGMDKTAGVGETSNGVHPIEAQVRDMI